MSDASPDASLTADDSFTETSAAGLTFPWGTTVPAQGETIRVADGVSWARLPMPGSLGHINTWLLDEGDGVAAVDTGLQLETCSDAWKALFKGALKDTPLTRVICTHLHPDHTGLAGWLCKKFGLELWMTRGEWLTIRMLGLDANETVPDEVLAMHKAAGWSQADIDAQKEVAWGRMRRVVYPLPMSYRRMQDGDTLMLGDQAWKVVVGSGHSPEHACLYNEKTRVLVSGDQVLPKISSNVSVHITEPEANPLAEWLDSIDKLLTLPDDLLVCPAHGAPFRGLHVRLRALRDEHHDRLNRLEEALAIPLRVIDCFSLLFNRTIGDEHRDLASGEALAHLRYLERTKRAVRTIKDGVHWYSAAAHMHHAAA
jgi:glyoxylase-like metal-dependent hydrolase (beta-lactamase superfamily II)